MVEHANAPPRVSVTVHVEGGLDDLAALIGALNIDARHAVRTSAADAYAAQQARGSDAPGTNPEPNVPAPQQPADVPDEDPAAPDPQAPTPQAPEQPEGVAAAPQRRRGRPPGSRKGTAPAAQGNGAAEPDTAAPGAPPASADVTNSDEPPIRQQPATEMVAALAAKPASDETAMREELKFEALRVGRVLGPLAVRGLLRQHAGDDILMVDDVPAVCLVAVSTAALTLYDMLKAVDRGMSFDVCLVQKTGGKSGAWQRDERDPRPDGP